MSKLTYTRLLNILNQEFPKPEVELNFKNPLELLVATILSAQCTDKRVNQVTEKFFRKYRTVRNYAQANLPSFETEIRATGFYKMKAKNIIGSCKMLLEEFDGKVPNSMEKLLTLPGVWRKTANVILGNCFGVNAFVVDTHVKRVCQRLGLSQSDDPDLIEKGLGNWLPPSLWTRASLQILLHGRYICKARSPHCQPCGFQLFCHWYRENEKERKTLTKKPQ
jgi:endonuclease-3